MSHIFEILMVLSFGCAWPSSIIKSFKARTTKGKSLIFLLIILFGYTCGIVWKFTQPGTVHWTVWFYILNFSMVFIDLILYFRNKKIDSIKNS